MFERSSFSSGQNEDASLPLSPEVSAVQTVSNKSTSIQARDLIPLYYATTRVSFSWQSSINNRGILRMERIEFAKEKKKHKLETGFKHRRTTEE